MREVVFVRKHQERWKELEKSLLESTDVAPDTLAEQYIVLTDDLAYAKAKYPKTQTLAYLNQLAAKAHSEIVRTRKESGKQVLAFWMHSVPEAMLSIRRDILVCLSIFVVMVALGFASGYGNDEVARSVLGDGYVDMTLENIKAGNPTGVYAREGGNEMFIMIFFNNLLVSVKCVGFGLFFVIGPLYVLMKNALMVGVFQAIFWNHGGFEQMFLSVYMHGAIELSEIVVAAAAAFSVGRKFLLPGTYTRKHAFVTAMKNSILILFGMIPFILIAALIESYVTRMFNMPLLLNLGVIFGTLFFTWWYIWILPQQLQKIYAKQQRRVYYT